MLRSHLLPAFALVLLLTSCTDQVDGSTVTTPADDKADPAPPTTTPAAVPEASAVVSDPNPAHGEPGHKCEIPVGASLSTAPATGSAQPGTAPTAITTTIPTPGAADAGNGTTAPGMNPPHGQPGHDCAVAVGSPLPK